MALAGENVEGLSEDPSQEHCCLPEGPDGCPVGGILGAPRRPVKSYLPLL
jgi:hypothetical protein